MVHPQNTTRGGSTVLIKDNMIHHEEAKYATNEIQATVVTVKTKQQAIMFAVVYCLPRYNLKKTNYLNFLKSLGERFTVRGDYNTKNKRWGSGLTTHKGKELYDDIKEYRCEYHSMSKPTYWPTEEKKIPDLLNFFITKKKKKNQQTIQAPKRNTD
jgi:hypothetical protein